MRHTVDDGRRELVVGEDRAPPAELDVGGEYHALSLVAVRYDLVQEPRPVHVDEQPAERPLPLGLAEPQHQLRGLPEPHGAAAEVAAIPRAVAMWILLSPARPQGTVSMFTRKWSEWSLLFEHRGH